MHLLHVVGKLLCNLKWKGLLKTGKFMAVVFFGTFAISSITSRRYCDDVTTRFKPNGYHVTNGHVQNSTARVVVSSLTGLNAAPVNRSGIFGHPTSDTKNRVPVKVLLVTYFRGGSSFLGEIINQIPDTFYVFEPIGPLYAYVYGAGGDRMSQFYSNGSLRLPAPFEKDVYASALSKMLSCRLHDLPTEFFTHKFRYLHPHAALKSYQTCMKEHSNPEVKRCSAFLPKTCRQDYDPSAWCQDQIQEVIDCVRVRDCSRYGEVGFFEHRQCLQDMHQQHVLPCLSIWQRACETAPVRMSKVVRLSMDAVTSLLSRDQSIKVVHLVRDPRGILPSRRTISQRYFEDLDKSASQLCQVMLRDTQIGEKLKQSYNGNFMQIKYEDLASKPVKTTGELFQFLGLTVSPKIEGWLQTATHGSEDTKGVLGVFRQNSTQTSLNWQNTLTDEEKNIIVKQCDKLLAHLHYKQ